MTEWMNRKMRRHLLFRSWSRDDDDDDTATIPHRRRRLMVPPKMINFGRQYGPRCVLDHRNGFLAHCRAVCFNDDMKADFRVWNSSEMEYDMSILDNKVAVFSVFLVAPSHRWGCCLCFGLICTRKLVKDGTLPSWQWTHQYRTRSALKLDGRSRIER